MTADPNAATQSYPRDRPPAPTTAPPATWSRPWSPPP